MCAARWVPSARSVGYRFRVPLRERGRRKAGRVRTKRVIDTSRWFREVAGLRCHEA